MHTFDFLKHFHEQRWNIWNKSNATTYYTLIAIDVIRVQKRKWKFIKMKWDETATNYESQQHMVDVMTWMKWTFCQWREDWALFLKYPQKFNQYLHEIGMGMINKSTEMTEKWLKVRKWAFSLNFWHLIAVEWFVRFMNRAYNWKKYDEWVEDAFFS